MEKTFEVTICKSSLVVKKLLISLIALSALLDLFIHWEIWSDHWSFWSKMTPNTLMLVFDLIVIPFNLISMGGCHFYGTNIDMSWPHWPSYLTFLARFQFFQASFPSRLPIHAYPWQIYRQSLVKNTYYKTSNKTTLRFFKISPQQSG